MVPRVASTPSPTPSAPFLGVMVVMILLSRFFHGGPLLKCGIVALEFDSCVGREVEDLFHRFSGRIS